MRGKRKSDISRSDPLFFLENEIKMNEIIKELIVLIIGATIGGVVAWKIAKFQISESKKQEKSKGIQSCIYNIMKVKEEIFNTEEVLDRNSEFIIISYSKVNKLQEKWSSCCKELYILNHRIIYLTLITKAYEYFFALRWYLTNTIDLNELKDRGKYVENQIDFEISKFLESLE